MIVWRKCKRCRRVYRPTTAVAYTVCQFCPGFIVLHFVRREMLAPLEAAYALGGIEAAQEIVTPGWLYPTGLGE